MMDQWNENVNRSVSFCGFVSQRSQDGRDYLCRQLYNFLRMREGVGRIAEIEGGEGGKGGGGGGGGGHQNRILPVVNKWRPVAALLDLVG